MMAFVPILGKEGKHVHHFSWTCLDCKVTSPARPTKEWSEKDWQDHLEDHKAQLRQGDEEFTRHE
jgi:hypothetical protein